jgi:iron complex outermembrane recepter protein
MHKATSALLITCAASALALGAHPGIAAAQDVQAARESDLEEVIVTARRREENLQDVPAAVTAITAEALERQNIRNPTDVQTVTPNLSIGGANSVFSRNSGNYSIRGVGQGLFGGSSVTSYFAEAPFGPTGPSMPFFDIESVQVLKGPQGTLFGRATAGGAVLIQPRVATPDDFYGSAQARVGNRGRADLDLMVNVPIIEDQLAARVAFNRTHIDGYVKNLVTGQEMDENNSYSIRGSLVFEPADWFRNSLVFNYYNFDANTAARVVVGANLGLANLNRTAAAFTNVCNTAVSFGNGAFGPGVINSSVAACQAQRVQILADIRAALVAEVERTRAGGERTITTSNTYLNRERLQRQDLVNTTQVDLPSVGPVELNVKNIFSYQRSRGVVNGNFSGTPFDLNGSSFGFREVNISGAQSNYINGRVYDGLGEYVRLYTNETQLNGRVFDDALIFIVGYYYQNTPVPTALGGSGNLNRTFGGVGNPDLGPISATQFPVGGYARETAYFGQFTADLSRVGLDGIHVTAGYRKTRTDQVNTLAASTIVYPQGRLVPGAITSSRTEGEGPGYTLALDWKASDDLLLYVTRRRGYKPGGINVAVGASAIPGFVPVFSPESVIDTELGAKWTFRLGSSTLGRLNVAAFQDDYTNIQRGVNAITPAGQNIAFTANVAEARIKGFEAEGLLLFGDHWMVSATYAYLDAAYTKWTGADPLGAAPAGTNIDLSNNPFANAPKNKFSVTLQYETELAADRGTLIGSVTIFGQDRSWFSDNAQRFIEVYKNDPRVIIATGSFEDAISDPGFVAANARLDWKGVLGHENIDAGLYVRNLTNELYAYAGSVSLQSIGITQKLFAEPRTYGIELTYRFGR